MHRTTGNARGLLAWLLIALMYSYQYILRNMPSASIDYIMDTFSISSEDFGQYAAIYYIGYTLIHIPAAILIDKYGPKFIVALSLPMISLGLLPMVYGESWMLVVIGRLIVGIFSATITVSLFKVVSLSFERHKFPFMLGMAMTLGLILATCGGQAVPYAANITGWESIILLLAVIGVFASILCFIFLPSNNEKVDMSEIFSGLKTIITRWDVIYLAVIGGLMVGSLEGFGDAWGSKFLSITYNLDSESASSLTQFILLGFGVGAPLLGYTLEKTQKFEWILLCCGIFMLLSVSTIFFGAHLVGIVHKSFYSYSGLATLIFFIGVFSAYQVILVSRIGAMFSAKIVSIATTTANMIIMLFGSFFHTAIAKVLGERQPADYTTDILSKALSVVPFAISLSILMLIAYMIIDRYRTKKKRQIV